ncbi:PQQ-dependent sugar dehydrogenase [Microbulbifer sp. CAU 1566]|uniref:PQQ-dependent sugar dehydrogenase n=1 Tax=Microbulbifer sp. CAU 1566 TaxID=2933269 RepID=UPI002006D547|nr:PQQ-dependent sugar dehydrogenase [Microbulbifer sp. CAU 1566]MCK7597682.1 PQQ-dependent sugar dehydrogenase [Microbulbifer sp. CAU 1566]
MNTPRFCTSSQAIRLGAMLLSILALPLTAAAAFATGYQPLGQTCDGLPKLPVGTMPGTCLGLLAGTDSGDAFIKPRKALELPEGNRILVTDMGGWGGGKGILWLLEYKEGGYTQRTHTRKLITGMNLPHDIKLGPDGLIYVGEANQITRFQLQGDQVIQRETVIDGLPYTAGDHLHPLTSFVFLPGGDLLVNAGSKTDDCGLSSEQQTCSELNTTGLRRYRYQAELNQWADDFTLLATGLRNSMALVVHASGTVLQGENSTDFKDAEEPYEEINVIQPGGFYGWPYCFNRRLSVGKDSAHCDRPDYVEPYSLMPPHVAPLDMLYYDGDLLPTLKNQLLVSWHGYRVVGNRLVSYATSSDGLPQLTERVTFNRDPIAPAQVFTSHTMAPRGGSSADAQHQEVIGQWNKVDGLRPEGAPVGLLQLKDGSLLIVDDKNAALLRLSRGEAYTGVSQQQQVTQIDGLHFDGATRQLLLNNCTGCHLELQGNPGELLNRVDGWLQKKNGATLLEQKLTSDSGFMPPTGKLNRRDIATILSSLNKDD